MLYVALKTNDSTLMCHILHNPTPQIQNLFKEIADLSVQICNVKSH